MKKIILITSAAVLGLIASTPLTNGQGYGSGYGPGYGGYDQGYDNRGYWGGSSQLSVQIGPRGRGRAAWEIRHLSRMRDHVRAKMRAYGAHRRLVREFMIVSRQVDEVNYLYRTGRFDRRELSYRVQSLHARLHRIEQNVGFRRGDFYIWR